MNGCDTCGNRHYWLGTLHFFLEYTYVNINDILTCIMCNFLAFIHYEIVPEVKPWEGFPKFIMLHSWDPKRNFVKNLKSIFSSSHYFLFRIHDAWPVALIVQYTEFISTVLPHTAKDEGKGGKAEKHRFNLTRSLCKKGPRPDRLWWPHRLLFYEYGRFLPKDKAAGT